MATQDWDTLTVTFDVALLYGKFYFLVVLSSLISRGMCFSTISSSLCEYLGYQGQYDQALPMHENCLENRKLVLGEDHPETLATMNHLANCYHYQGQYGKSEPLFEAVLQKRRAVLGEDHPHTLKTMNNLANTYQRQGQYYKAEPLLEACLKKMTAVLGVDHPQSLTSMNDLAYRFAMLPRMVCWKQIWRLWKHSHKDDVKQWLEYEYG